MFALKDAGSVKKNIFNKNVNNIANN